MAHDLFMNGFQAVLRPLARDLGRVEAVFDVTASEVHLVGRLELGEHVDDETENVERHVIRQTTVGGKGNDIEISNGSLFHYIKNERVSEKRAVRANEITSKCTMGQNQVSLRHLISHFLTSKGVSKVSEQANE